MCHSPIAWLNSGVDLNTVFRKIPQDIRPGFEYYTNSFRVCISLPGVPYCLVCTFATILAVPLY